MEIEKLEIEKDFDLFVDILNYFLSYHLGSSNNNYLEIVIPIFQSYFNYLENIFYFKGTNFHKKQQIEIIQNFLLSLNLKN